MLGIRLDPDTERGLEAIARSTRRPKSQIAREAIQQYIARNDGNALARAQWRTICDNVEERRELDALLDYAAANAPNRE